MASPARSQAIMLTPRGYYYHYYYLKYLVLKTGELRQTGSVKQPYGICSLTGSMF